jgi:hypothetical protein
VVVLAACGGGDDAEPGAPAESDIGGGAAPAQTAQPAAQQAEGADEQAPTGLVREVFSYQGGGRDPFVSPLATGEVKPMPEDLEVTGIIYNAQYPMNSVAVLRDTRELDRYTVRVGDALDPLGRVRIAAIRSQLVIIAYEEFGRELQDTLQLRRSQEENQ